MRILLAVVIWFVPVLVEGATYYVSQSGNDSSSCLEATNIEDPRKTIGGGIECLSAGDTLYIKAGVYKEVIHHSDIPSGISEGSETVVAGWEDDEVILKPDTGGLAGDVIRIWRLSYVIFRNLIIDATNVSVQGIRIQEQSHHVRIEDSEIKNAPNSNCIGIQDYASHHITFTNLKVHNCGAIGSNQHHGIYLRGSDHIVEKSEIYNITGHGIHQWGSKKENHNVIIRGNRCHDNGSWGILIGSGDNNVAVNNIVWNNGNALGGTGGGIRIGFLSPKDNQIINNTVYANQGNCIRIRSGSSDSVVKNNICYQNGTDTLVDLGSGTQEDKNLLVNPGFSDESSYDFELSEGSAAIDTGEIVGIVVDDINGNVRPFGVSYDVGAFEFVGGSPADTNPLPPTGLQFAN